MFPRFDVSPLIKYKIELKVKNFPRTLTLLLRLVPFMRFCKILIR